MTISRVRSTVGRRLLAAALSTLVSGCAFVSVQRHRPPAAVEDPGAPDTCTTSSGAAVADTVIGAAALVGGYIAMIVSVMDDIDNCWESSSTTCDEDHGSPAAGLAIMGAGAVYAGSAVYGYVSTAQCRRRVAASGRCADGDLGACQKVKPGWAPPPGWRSGPSFAPRPVPVWPEAPAAAAPPPAGTPAPSTSEWTHEPATPPAPK
jgi:hypothetical protein